MQITLTSLESGWTAGNESILKSIRGPSDLTTHHDRSSDAKTGSSPLQNLYPFRSWFAYWLIWTDWQLWTAATVTNGTLRTDIIKLVKKYASSGINNKPFPDRYNSENGQAATFEDRSVVGGHFALVRCLALFSTRRSQRFISSLVLF